MFNFLKNLFKKKDPLQNKINLLEKEIYDLKMTRIEDYLSERMLVDTSDGFQIKFLGEMIVKILAKCFWLMVCDSEKYLIFTFQDAAKGEGVEVIIVKEGHLTPLERLEELEIENFELKEELRKYSN